MKAALPGSAITVEVEERRVVRAADALVDVLVEHGVEVLFGLPGGPISPVHDALIDQPRVRVVTTRHESGALFAAAGYAQATGKLGVALVTSGPGVLNAVTGLASAWCDGLPVLLLIGEVPRRNFGRGALQDGSAQHLNIVAMTSHVTKLSLEVSQPGQIPTLVQRAIATALTGRQGPVAITLPMDTTLQPIVAPDMAIDVTTSFAISPSAIDRVVTALGDARRGVIYAGSGVRRGHGPSLLRELAERLQWPVITSPKAKGVFPDEHPLALGLFGIGGHRSATEYLEGGIDTLLGLGSGFGDMATEGWSALLQPKRHFIQVDIEARQIGRAYPVTLGIVAPVEHFLRRLLTQDLPAAPARTFGLQQHVDPMTLTDGPEGRIAPPRAIWEMQQVLPDDTIFLSDMGEHQVFALHYLKLSRPDTFFMMSGLGSMGSSIGGAIGAQLAQPRRRVAAIIGDGCLAMYASEIATAVAQRLPIVLFVMNDQRLGMVELGHQNVYGRKPSYPTEPMNVRQLAESLGARSLVATHAGDILAARPLLNAATRPVVVDVRIDRQVRMPKKERFDAAPKGPAVLRAIS